MIAEQLDALPEMDPDWKPTLEQLASANRVFEELSHWVSLHASGPARQEPLGRVYTGRPVKRSMSDALTSESKAEKKNILSTPKTATLKRSTKPSGRKFTKLSKFCHTCSAPAHSNQFVACGLVAFERCGKIVCRRCCIQNNIDFELARESGDFHCLHCRAQCPSWSRCKTYAAFNAARSAARRAGDS